MRTARQYWQDSKGHHDIKDYARAILIIGATVVAMWYFVR